MALNFGADDIDGTIGEEKSAHAAKARVPRSRWRVVSGSVSLIREAGRACPSGSAIAFVQHRAHVFEDEAVALARMKKIAQIAYTNTAPIFRHGWPEPEFPLQAWRALPS